MSSTAAKYLKNVSLKGLFCLKIIVVTKRVYSHISILGLFLRVFFKNLGMTSSQKKIVGASGIPIGL